MVYAAKNIPAADASTGEQKALLIGLVLAHAGLLAEMTGFAPVLLLDEVVAHLDPGPARRALRALETLGAQVWMTGADPAAFAEIGRAAQMFRGRARAAWRRGLMQDLSDLAGAHRIAASECIAGACCAIDKAPI